MNRTPDARLPLRFGEAREARATDAILSEGFGAAAPGHEWFQPKPASAHDAGCSCCAARGPAALALTRLLLARGRGSPPFFQVIIADTRTTSGRDAVLAALSTDPVVSAQIRLQPGRIRLF